MRLVLFIIPVFFLMLPEKANAFVWSFGGEKIVKVGDLPDSDEYRDESGTLQDAYVIYKHGWILWIPVWNWDARYVLSSGGERFYEFADESYKAQVVSKHGPPGNAIPFWDKIGGKILWVVILAICGFVKYGGNLTGSANTNTHQPYIPSPPQASGFPNEIHINRDGQQYGPYSHEQAKAMLSSGDLSESDQAWYQGAEGWVPLNQVPGIK